MKLLCKTPPFSGHGLSLASCRDIDQAALIFLGAVLLALAISHPRTALRAIKAPFTAIYGVYRYLRRRQCRHEFYEVHRYALQRETASANGRSSWIYPEARWESISFGAMVVKKAVLRVTFPLGIRRKTIEADLDLWSGAWKRWFYSFEADETDPRVIRLHAASVPKAVDFSGMPSDLPEFTAFLGLSERLQPLTRNLADDSFAHFCAPSGAGKSTWAAMYLLSVLRTTPLVRIVVITTKHLALFRRIPGARVFNAFNHDDLTQLRDLISELRRTADENLQLLDDYHVEHIEDLYKLGVVTPETHPRWVLLCDEAKDYLKPLRKPTADHPFSAAEESYAALLELLGHWIRKARCLSRHCLIALQDPSAGALAPQIELGTISWRVVGRMREVMSRAVVQSERPAREPVPRGVFFLHDESGELIKFRGPYDARLLAPATGGNNQ